MDHNEGKQGKPNTARSGKRMLTLFGLWLLFTAIVLAIGLPIVLDSIRQSGVLALLEPPTKAGPTSFAQQAKVWFFTSDGSIREFRQSPVKRGGSSYHDTFESLLGGPDYQALKGGAVSEINAKTTLLGLTLSNNVLYLDLSKQFLESQDIRGAYEQLKKTAQSFSQVKDIVLLIEGERAVLPNAL